MVAIKRLGITISLEGFNNIKYETEQETMEECIMDIIKYLSKVNLYEIDVYIENILIPMLKDQPKKISWYKRFSKKQKILRKLNEEISASWEKLENERWKQSNLKRKTRLLKDRQQQTLELLHQIRFAHGKCSECLYNDIPKREEK